VNYNIGTKYSDGSFRIAKDNSNLDDNVRLIIDTNGNVGIGTTSPADLLSLEKATTPIASVNWTDTTSYGGFRFKEGGATAGSVQMIGSTFATTSRRNNIELFNNISTGGIALHVNNSATPGFLLNSSGNVGIGTTAPNSRLTANTQSPSANALLFNVQNTGSNVFSVDAEGDFFYDGTGSSPSADVAEIYPTTETGIVSGEIVSLSVGDNNAQTVIRSGMASDPNLLGVVTTKPALLLGSNVESGVAVALIGRVPVKVNDQNGEIKKGDYITSSSIVGEGMKATVAGMVVGRALSNAECVTSNQQQVISNQESVTSNGETETTCTTTVFTNLSWYDPNHEALALSTTPIDTAKYKDLTTDTMTVNQTLSVLGASTFTDATVTKTFNVGLLSIEDSSINVAGGVLNLQNAYGSGNIKAFGGKIVMTTDGSIQVLGSIDAQSIKVDQGVTVKDKVTGDYYCMTVENGLVVSIPGECQ